jgi:branched-chain amino acid aminotransferase
LGVVVLINGQSHPPETACISVFDRGLLYGDSVFETIGTYSGRPFALEEHVRRLRRSADLVRIRLECSDADLIREVTDAIARGGNAESYIRVIVTRGSGELGLDPALAVNPQRIVIVTPLVRPPAAAYTDGVSAVTIQSNRATDATDAIGAKVGNYLVAVLAMEKARAAAANEALIVDRNGAIIEGATSNVFWVSAGNLWTPAESAGILAGITRSVVMAAAAELGVGLSHACLPVEELDRIDELFITSSIRQMLAIVAVDGRPIGNGKPGPLYHQLFRRFQRIVQQDPLASPAR